MNLLTFDTCLDKMYVTLSKDGEIVDSKIVETTKEHYHSAFLISTITEILKENNIAPQGIDAVATDIGPGSFTGIRACTTVARVFAQANNCKAVGVSSLEILSKITPHPTLSPKGREENRILVSLDARKESAYIAVYKDGKQILEPQVMLIEKIKELISEKDYEIITDKKLQPLLGGISYEESSEDLGKNLSKIAYEKIQQGADADWKRLLPLYIQPPAVSTNVKK